jgi:EpsD family peptidyl-prolyl cis-trans isomerase
MRFKTVALVGAAVLALGACDDKGGKPSGQVVASVNGEDVTVHELNAEMAGLPATPTTPKKQLEQQALQNIVTRRLLMQTARDRKLDQTPQFLMQQRRTSEQLLVASLGRDISSKVEPVTAVEATDFQRRYPNMFSERKFMILDQIQFLRPNNISSLPLNGAKTMDQVEQVLSAANIEYRRQPASLDALSANPAFVDEVVALYRRNPNEVFMFANQPAGAPAPVILVNRIVEMRTIPFTGQRANAYARSYLQNAKVQGALAGEIKRLRETAAEKVTYQPGYAPPKATPGATKAGARPTPEQVAKAAENPIGDNQLAVPTGAQPTAATK